MLFTSIVIVSLGFNSIIPSEDSQLEMTLSGMTKAEPHYKRGFIQGYQDAREGFKNRYGRNKLARKNPYEKGYFRGYRHAAYHTQQFDLLRDSPSRSFGSDFNGDGIHDMLIGTDVGPRPNGGLATGLAYIVFGSETIAGSGTKNLGGNASPDVTFLGSHGAGALTGDEFADAQNLASAGDVNGDGIDDIIIGSKINDRAGTDRGAAWVFFGSTSLGGTTFDVLGILSSSTSDMTVLGKANSDYLGNGVAGIGDVNGDGFDDIAIGADGNDDAATGVGATYVFFGSGNLSGTKYLSGNASADFTVLGADGDTPGTQTQSGFVVSSAGDFNGDGFDDFIIGGPNGLGTSASGFGVAWVIFGSASLSGTRNLNTTGSADFTLIGQSSSDKLGFSLSGGGDINGDGFDDIMVGMPYADFGAGIGSTRGGAFVYFGGSGISGTQNISLATASPDFSILGQGAADKLSEFGISAAGDINDDGFDDMIFGSYRADLDGRTDSGAAYVIFGSSTLKGTTRATWQALAKQISPLKGE